MNITSILTIALSVIASSVFAGPNCGKGIGKCPDGECCSQYGYCGTTSDHCENTLGCQTKYGSCYASTAKGKCGKEYGRCPKPYHCCSKSGYCGEGDDYCGTGCQSAYGLCGDEQMEIEEDVEWVTEVVTEYVYVYVEEVSDSRECGSDVNKKCDNGKCCSKYGYCGTTDAYCSVSKGCQPKFGDCYEVVDTASVASVASADSADSDDSVASVASVLDIPECEGTGSCDDGIDDQNEDVYEVKEGENQNNEEKTDLFE